MIQLQARSAGVLATLLLAACASSGGASSAVDSSARTASAAERLSAALGRLASELEAVDEAIDGVRGTVGTEGFLRREKVARGDIPAAFSGYQSALRTARGTHGRVESMNATLGREMESYLSIWDRNLAQMHSEELVSMSTRRREEARGRFERVGKAYQEVWDLCTAQMQHLEELELAMGSELTPDGIGGLDGALSKARNENQGVEKGLTKVSSAMAELSSALRSGSPEPAE